MARHFVECKLPHRDSDLLRSVGISELLWKLHEPVAQADSLRLEFLHFVAGYQPAPPADIPAPERASRRVSTPQTRVSAPRNRLMKLYYII